MEKEVQLSEGLPSVHRCKNVQGEVSPTTISEISTIATHTSLLLPLQVVKNFSMSEGRGFRACSLRPLPFRCNLRTSNALPLVLRYRHSMKTPVVADRRLVVRAVASGNEVRMVPKLLRQTNRRVLHIEQAVEKREFKLVGELIVPLFTLAVYNSWRQLLFIAGCNDAHDFG